MASSPPVFAALTADALQWHAQHRPTVVHAHARDYATLLYIRKV
jgi:hypothetical protein